MIEVKEDHMIQQATPGSILQLKPSEQWQCSCGETYPLGMWVAAHWNERITHTCPKCGVKRWLCGGVLTTPGKL